MKPQLFSASLLLGLIPMTAGLAAFLILIWSGLHEFIAPALPGATADPATIPPSGWSPVSLIPGVGVAIAGWATAFYFHNSSAHPSASWSDRKKTLYVFFLNQGYFDQVYEALIIRPYLRLASWLWQTFDVRLIDGPSTRAVNASFNAAAGLSKVITFEKTDAPRVSYALMILLGILMLLLVLAEEIEIYLLG